jgi:GTP cyclohydrolase II
MECKVQARIPSVHGNHRILYYNETREIVPFNPLLEDITWIDDERGTVVMGSRVGSNTVENIMEPTIDFDLKNTKESYLTNTVNATKKQKHSIEKRELYDTIEPSLKDSSLIESPNSEFNGTFETLGNEEKHSRNTTSAWDDENHLALVFGPFTSKSLLGKKSKSKKELLLSGISLTPTEYTPTEAPLVRIHSCCFTGETLGSTRCDCAEQLHTAMKRMENENGIIVYLKQEGRGIGLLDKLQCYNLIDSGEFDTMSANLELGHKVDLREYRVAALILKDLGIDSIRLMTNNPDKIKQLEQSGIEIIERVEMRPRNWDVFEEKLDRDDYLVTKVMKMGHLLSIPTLK